MLTNRTARYTPTPKCPNQIYLSLNSKRFYTSFRVTLKKRPCSRGYSYSYKFKSYQSQIQTVNNTFIIKNKLTSNGNRSSFSLKNTLNVNHTKSKFFFYKTKSSRGRVRGRIVCRTKGTRTVTPRYPIYNKSIRTLYLTYITGFYINPNDFKSFSLISSAAGELFYTSTTYSHVLFHVFKRYSIFNKPSYLKYNYLSNFIKIPQHFFTLFQLPKHKFINSLELYPLKGSQYIKAPGSKGSITKFDFSKNLTLIKLPSGIYKIFSLYSTGSYGIIPIHYQNIKTRPNAGFFKKAGRKSLTRGVAKNPTDHPHGGRNKAIKYQRTPWGKTTKYK